MDFEEIIIDCINSHSEESLIVKGDFHSIEDALKKDNWHDCAKEIKEKLDFAFFTRKKAFEYIRQEFVLEFFHLSKDKTSKECMEDERMKKIRYFVDEIDNIIERENDE